MSFLKSVVVARGLGVEFYGLYVLITNFVLTVQDFFDLNISAGVVRYGAIYRNDNRIDKLISLIKLSLLSVMVTSLLSIGIITLIVFLFYDRFITHPGLELFIILYAIADLTTFIDPLGKGLLRLYYRFKLNSIIQSLSSLAELIIISVTIFVFNGDLKAFIISLIIARILTAAAYLGGMYWELSAELMPHVRARMSLIKDQYRELLGFVIGNAMTRTLVTLGNRGDALLLGTLAGPTSLAFYNLAKRTANMLMTIADPFAQGIFPQLANLMAQKRFAEVKIMLLKLSRSAAVPLLLSIPLLFIINEWFFRTIYGQDYVQASDSFMILYVASILVTVFFWNHSFMLAAGLLKTRFYFILFSLLAGFGLAWWLIPSWKETGMAAGALLIRFIQFTAMSLVAFRFLKVPTQPSPADGIPGKSPDN
jgi:O-antigen/teichoic acid export membrane protein